LGGRHYEGWGYIANQRNFSPAPDVAGCSLPAQVHTITSIWRIPDQLLDEPHFQQRFGLQGCSLLAPLKPLDQLMPGDYISVLIAGDNTVVKVDWM